MFLPTYSPFLNSQESVWVPVKAELFKHFARIQREIKTQVDLEGEMDYILDGVTVNHRNEDFFMSIREELQALI